MFNSALNMMQLQSDKLSEVELCKMTLGYFQSWLGRVQEEFFLVLLKCIDWIFAVSRDEGACRIVAMLHLSHKGNHLTTYHQLFRPTQNNFMLHISHWLTSGNQSHNKDFGNEIMLDKIWLSQPTFQPIPLLLIAHPIQSTVCVNHQFMRIGVWCFEVFINFSRRVSGK